MKRLLASPVINAVCIGIFTAFYASVFLMTSNRIEFASRPPIEEAASFWAVWSGFLAAGHQQYIACALAAVTILIIVLLLIRRRHYDEYHISVLTHCIVAAAVLTLAAIAAFYLMILCEPAAIIEKFTLFITIHWTTVVFADLTYVLLYRWR